MAAHVVIAGPAFTRTAAVVPANTLADTFVIDGLKRGLTLENAYVGANGLSYAVVGTEDVIRVDSNLEAFTDGQKVYVKSDSVTFSGSAPVAASVASLGTTAASGGTFAAGTYFWKVAAVTPGGDTAASNEVTAALVLNGTQVLNWTAVAGATGYKVYRGTVAGAENILVTTTGNVLTYTDTGTAGSASTVPAGISGNLAVGYAHRAKPSAVSGALFVRLLPGLL
jgi:hypothetical protein